jgi:ribosomal-protein-alanine N-acetyltransferase
MLSSNRQKSEPAPPAEGIALREMQISDLDQVLRIEKASFGSPWKMTHFLHEIEKNRWAVNWVVVDGERVVGYVCCWCIHEELKINNIAVHQDERGRGLGRWLMLHVLAEALERGCRSATLEVRPSNVAAISLYRSFGFDEVGRRPNYYATEGEDAVVMGAEISRKAWRAIASRSARGV